MKIVLMLFLFIFLSACTVYTVTNKTKKDLTIEKAGGGVLTLRALKCAELSEYILGLGGDFPFIVNGENVEHGAGNYEIKPDNKKTLGYTLELSEKNTSCEPEEQKESDGSKKDSDKPMCNDGKEATCYESTAKCVVEEGENKKLVCVDENGENIESVKPECMDKSKPTCPTKGGLVLDQERQALCVKGAASCTEGEVACVREDQLSKPICVKDGEEVENESVSCPGSDSGLKCLKSVKVEVKNDLSVSCVDGTEPSCADGSKAVCGSISTDNRNRPYCVNDESFRWSDNVSCTGDSESGVSDTNDANKPGCKKK